MALFDGMNNPWAPGGQMSPRMPWAQPGLNYGWGHGNEFFTPKTKEQIRDEGLLQMAVLAAILVAPALVGAAGGAGGAAAASGGAGAAAGGAAAESAGAALVQGAGAAAGAGAGLSAGAWASIAGGAATAAILRPFLQPDSSQALLQAARMGEVELNRELHRLSQPSQRVEVWEDGNSKQGINRVHESSGSIGKAAPAIAFLSIVAEKIQNQPELARVLSGIDILNLDSSIVSKQAILMLSRTLGEGFVPFHNHWQIHQASTFTNESSFINEPSHVTSSWTLEELRTKVANSVILRLLERRVFENPDSGFHNTYSSKEETWRNPIQTDLPDNGPPSRINFRRKDIEIDEDMGIVVAATLYAYELQHAVNYRLGEKGDHPEKFSKEEYLNIVFEMETDAQITVLEYEMEAGVDVMSIPDEIKIELKYLIQKFRVDYNLPENQLVADFRVDELKYGKKQNRRIQKIRTLANPRYRPNHPFLPFYERQWQRAQ